MTLEEFDHLFAQLIDPETPVHVLTFVAEEIGDCDAPYVPRVRLALSRLLDHPSKVVREGALYGLAKTARLTKIFEERSHNE